MLFEWIEVVYLIIYNWGKLVKFFQVLGFRLEFEIDYNLGQLCSGDGLFLFIVEVLLSEMFDMQVVFKVVDEQVVQLQLIVEVVMLFEDMYWGMCDMMVCDLDGWVWCLQVLGKQGV